MLEEDNERGGWVFQKASWRGLKKIQSYTVQPAPPTKQSKKQYSITYTLLYKTNQNVVPQITRNTSNQGDHQNPQTQIDVEFFKVLSSNLKHKLQILKLFIRDQLLSLECLWAIPYQCYYLF